MWTFVTAPLMFVFVVAIFYAPMLLMMEASGQPFQPLVSLTHAVAAAITVLAVGFVDEKLHPDTR